jgi:hypothetical protein
MNDELETTGRKWLSPNRDTTLAFTWRGEAKPQKL